MAIHAVPGMQQCPSLSRWPLRDPSPHRTPSTRRLRNRKLVLPWNARVRRYVAECLRRCVYEGAAWKLIGDAGAVRPGVPALPALQPCPERWPEKTPLVPRVPDWLAAGDLGPPGVDMVPPRGSVFVAVSRPKVSLDLEQDRQRLHQIRTLAEVVNERTDRLGIWCADATPGRGDKIHLWLRVWTLSAWPKNSLRQKIQDVLNNRWGRNHVGKVVLR